MIVNENSGEVEQERQIEMILLHLEKLGHLSRDAEVRLQQFTERVFGRVHEHEVQKESLSSPEKANICKILSWRIRVVTATVQSISLEIDSMTRELPQRPKTELEG